MKLLRNDPEVIHFWSASKIRIPLRSLVAVLTEKKQKHFRKFFICQTEWAKAFIYGM